MNDFLPKEKSSIKALNGRFIESPNFPFSKISEASRVEKGPGRPPHWEMVFWWTRKPLISARAIIAGSLLPENTDPEQFLSSIGIRSKGTAHRNKPDYNFEGVKLLDPFAGFGSIPLEAMRLGISATAVELLPTAYVFLKAILEYPSKYGSKLVKDVEKWGNWVTEKLREDPLIKELYDEDVAVYIGTWEIKCPNCGKWTLLVGNWWLARVKGKEGYERLVWMEPKKNGDEIAIKVVDLNKELGNEALKKAKVEENKVVVKEKEYRVPESTIEARRELGTCLHCNQPIMQIDPETGRHYTETKNLPEEVKNRLESYVKFALKLYNKSIDYKEIENLPNWTKEVPARLRLLVKVKRVKSDLKFEPCAAKDQEKLELAKQEIEKLLKQNDSSIPQEYLWGYTASGGGCLSIWVWGFDRFYKLFNARQLLTLVKLVKLIREAGKQIEQEKLKEGLSKEEAFKYAEAITTYLTIILSRFADYNTLVTAWNGVTGLGSISVLCPAHTLSFRGIAMTWNWCDMFLDANMSGSFTRTLSNIVDALSYLVSAVPNGSRKVRVLLDDATVLSKLNNDARFNLIVTDPPYYDDVPYAELSDFYYVWLKRALSDITNNNKLVPRFVPEAFFEKVGNNWVEISTQWEKYALSEVSLNPPRLGSGAKYEDGVKHFQNLLNSSFTNMTSRLSDDGLLVTYYAHTDPDAWKALIEAGWKSAGLRITNAFPITTESEQSVVKRGKLSMDTSIVVVWRKGSSNTIKASDLYEEMVESAANRARRLLDLDISGRDLVIGTLSAALASATKYHEVLEMGKLDVGTLVDKYVYPATYLGLARALARKAEVNESIKSPDGMFYLLVKSISAGAKKKMLESTDARLFSIGTSLDLNSAIKTLKILGAGEKEGGAKVAKAKTLVLREPTSSERSKLAELLEVRDVGVSSPNIRCAVDALHFLEYLAVYSSREEFKQKLEEIRAKFPLQVEDALIMAKTMAKVLPTEDVEKNLCSRIVDYLTFTPISYKNSKEK
jgi:putative DNA methylase